MTLFSQRLNRQWIAQGVSNSPLGLYLGIDFEVIEVKLKPSEHWDRLNPQFTGRSRDLAAAECALQQPDRGGPDDPPARETARSGGSLIPASDRVREAFAGVRTGPKRRITRSAGPRRGRASPRGGRGRRRRPRRSTRRSGRRRRATRAGSRPASPRGARPGAGRPRPAARR